MHDMLKKYPWPVSGTPDRAENRAVRVNPKTALPPRLSMEAVMASIIDLFDYRAPIGMFAVLN
jgi:hypothetical protein